MLLGERTSTKKPATGLHRKIGYTLPVLLLLVVSSFVAFIALPPPVVAANVTQPILVTVKESGAPGTSFTVVGCNASPSSGSTGSTLDVSMQPSCSFDVQISSSGQSRYMFEDCGTACGSTSSTYQTSCGSGTCSTATWGVDYQEELIVTGTSYSLPPSETGDNF